MDLFWQNGGKGGGVSPIPKGFYHKILIFSSNTEFFSEFSAKKGGGSRPIQNFLSRKNLGIQIDRGGGGLARSEKLQKKPGFFFDASPNIVKQPSQHLKLISQVEERKKLAKQTFFQSGFF